MAVSAWFFSWQAGDIVGLLFQKVLTGRVIILLLLWFVAAMGVRRLFRGHARKLSAASPLMIFGVSLFADQLHGIGGMVGRSLAR